MTSAPWDRCQMSGRPLGTSSIANQGITWMVMIGVIKGTQISKNTPSSYFHEHFKVIPLTSLHWCVVFIWQDRKTLEWNQWQVQSHCFKHDSIFMNVNKASHMNTYDWYVFEFTWRVDNFHYHHNCYSKYIYLDSLNKTLSCLSKELHRSCAILMLQLRLVFVCVNYWKTI